MNEYLIQRDKSNFSAYITDKNPQEITTNGALTIIDNTDSSIYNYPFTYNLFLDNLFLAGGYGFSTYNDYATSQYILSTYNDAYTYILTKLDELKNNDYIIEYTYNENKLDKNYNIYGCLTSYKYLEVSKQPNSNTYIFELKDYGESNICYIKQFDFRIGDEIDNFNIVKSFKSDNIVPVGESVNLTYFFEIYGNSSNKNEYLETSPDIYINNELLDFDDLNIGTDNNNIRNLQYYYSIRKDDYYNENISLITKKDDNIIYSYNYQNVIKWRYKFLPFNTNTLNILFNISSVSLTDIYLIDQYEFDDDRFNLTDVNNSLFSLFNFVKNSDIFNDHSVFLDDNINIEFIGNGYKYNNDILYMHDYILFIENNTDQLNSNKIEFYYNNILTNWKFLKITESNSGTITYKLFQSPRRYMGKHIWNIKYNNG